MPSDAEPPRPPLDAAPPLPPEPWPVPWRQILAWAVAVFVVVWALVLLPGVIRRYSGEVPGEEDDLAMPEMLEDPVLTPKVQELMARGKVAERDGRLVEARGLYYRAWTEQPACYSCALRRRIVERLIREESIAGLEAGGRYLAELRFEEAAEQYREVLALVPHESASFHVLAKDGLEKTKVAAKQAGKPLRP